MTADRNPGLFPLPEPGEGDTAVLLRLSALTERLEALEEMHLDDAPDHDNYKASPPPQIWLMERAEYDALIADLRPWVDDVWLSTFGHLTGPRLAECWPNHPLAVWVLDLMSELHKVLYIRSSRPASVLSAQAEYVLRLLPQAAQLMEAELRGCRNGHQEVK